MENTAQWEGKNSTEPLIRLEKCVESVKEDSTKTTENLNVKEHSKPTSKISGIYKIVNKVNGKYYVGSSETINIRWGKHKSCLKHNKHWNGHLQNAYNKDGIDNFEYIIIEEVCIEKLLEVEQKYLNICKQFPDTNYMIAYDSTAPMRGKVGWNKGKKMSKQYCENVKIGLKKAFPKGRIYIKGIPISESRREKLKISNKKFYENKDNLEKHRKLWQSDEYRRKVSEGKKKAYALKRSQTSV